jgi:phage tail sheath protein FI
MAEYLAPGVYVEETSFRAKSIEGVSTSTAGFVGLALYGPTRGEPVLITSYEEHRRYFGGIEDLVLAGVSTTNYLAHAVRSFFENGGKRVYVARVFEPTPTTVEDDAVAFSPTLTAGATNVVVRARFPGLAGNLDVRMRLTRGQNVCVGAQGSRRLVGLRTGDVVQVRTAGTSSVTLREEVIDTTNFLDGALLDQLFAVEVDPQGVATLYNSTAPAGLDLNASVGLAVQRITLTLEAGTAPERVDVYTDLSPHPSSAQGLSRVMRTADPTNGIEAPYDRAARVWVDWDGSPTHDDVLAFVETVATAIADADDDPWANYSLGGGDDGVEADPETFAGGGTDHSATGLAALAEVDDIAIVAAPGSSALSTADARQAARDALITHCENLRYRFAILSGPRDADTTTIRDIRAQHDSSYAGLYYPWVVVSDPNGSGGATVELPPEGFMAGIYGRSDIQRGVHKAPANEVVRGALRFSRHVDKGTQDVLNPLGINCLRFFEGRGYRVWGARTMSSDPEWKYINVRRVFIFLEHSIDNNTQWAVFEPNNHTLWLKIRLTIESFLTDVWRTGALLGTSADDAFFVRCDRSTMTQGDLDNGRLICLIGVAPTKPAEFVIFRIGQWTADASIL